MDEWFLAGDSAFLEKARRRVEEMVLSADILVLSTHDNETIRRWCTRVLWLEQGRIVADGPPDEVLARYEAATAVPNGT